MNRDEHSPDNHDDTRARPDNAPKGQPEPPNRSKDLPDLPNPAEVGEDGRRAPSTDPPSGITVAEPHDTPREISS
jgi:hypothetical protein